ncbi:hypothetical protein CDD83_7349 [Cordyceps sp. RAO-2017]|nr:hypothetical protein CDD83_7349 [Cordyceps sp. RAO-2017]
MASAAVLFLRQATAAERLLTFILASAVFCLTARSIWRLYWHPLSKYPGPKIAAVSDLWHAYHSLSGRWPWAVEDAIKKYGPVVRIAPNELVFATPQALAGKRVPRDVVRNAQGLDPDACEAMKDLYGSHSKNLELFPKTQINNHGNDEHGGIIWEWDPVRHRQVSKQLSSAFSGRALRAKEPTLHKYIDLFVERARALGWGPSGLSLPTWINWLQQVAAVLSAPLHVLTAEAVKEPPYLTLLSDFNKAIVVIQASWRFPLLTPLKHLFLLLTAMKPHSHIRAHSREQLERRIRRKGAVEHLDFFEQLIPESREPPAGRREMRHLEQVAGQLLVAGYEPPSLWLYYTVYHLSKNAGALRTATDEVRGAFQSYADITAGAAAELPYLTACLGESLRMMPGILTGMPVVSPGAAVDGVFIPKGVVCQSSSFALARNPRHFRDSLRFRPERWLAKEHRLFDERFADDDVKSFYPFSQGPRMCSGREIAWWQSRVFLAKVLWTFDLSMVVGQDVDLDRDLRGWGMYKKPEVRVRFIPRS